MKRTRWGLAELKGVHNLVKLEEWWKTLGQKLVGYYQCHGISGNMEGVKMTYSGTLRLAYKWINRRSQKKSYNGPQFNRFLEYKPLPKPRIYHVTYTLSS